MGLIVHLQGCDTRLSQLVAQLARAQSTSQTCSISLAGPTPTRSTQPSVCTLAHSHTPLLAAQEERHSDPQKTGEHLRSAYAKRLVSLVHARLRPVTVDSTGGASICQLPARRWDIGRPPWSPSLQMAPWNRLWWRISTL